MVARKIKLENIRKHDVVAVQYANYIYSYFIFGVVFNPNREGQLVVCKHASITKNMICGDTVNINLKMLEEKGSVFLIGRFNRKKNVVEKANELKKKKVRI